MEAVFTLLWPGEIIPENFFDFAVRLQEASARIEAWKASAAREGARQAWATLQANFPGLDIGPIMKANRKG